MITGTHALIYTTQPEAVRDFLGELLAGHSVDAGGGWLIFALPPAEVGVHPAESNGTRELHLMCDDIEATVADLAARGIECNRPVRDDGFGLTTAMTLPDGSEIGLYEPRHPVATTGG
jgi:hypothetical protein